MRNQLKTGLLSTYVWKLQGGASALETAAAEMSQAAGSLVAIERRIGELQEQGVCILHWLFQNHSRPVLSCWSAAYILSMVQAKQASM